MVYRPLVSPGCFRIAKIFGMTSPAGSRSNDLQALMEYDTAWLLLLMRHLPLRPIGRTFPLLYAARGAGTIFMASSSRCARLAVSYSTGPMPFQLRSSLADTAATICMACATHVARNAEGGSRGMTRSCATEQVRSVYSNTDGVTHPSGHSSAPGSTPSSRFDFGNPWIFMIPRRRDLY